MEKTQEEYVELIRKNFPDIIFSDVSFITKGWDNNVLILDDEWVFRFPKKQEYTEKFKSELKLLKYLLPKAKIPIPAYECVPEDMSFGGYKILKGVEFKPDIFDSLQQVDKSNIAKELGSFLSVVHETPTSVAKEMGIEEEEGGYWWSKIHTQETYEKLKELVFPKLSNKEVIWIQGQFETYLSLSFNFDVTVIHSDFVGDHIFVDPNEGMVSGIIDFADVELSDPALDFTGMWYYGEDFVREVIANYKGRVGSDFIERSKFPRLVHMVGNMLELEEGGNIPETFQNCHKKLVDAMESGISM